ncbi:MAG: hypothetical protein KBF73_10335 [Flavobacteriales bacterium]|nr:hypothetical protein [Flavobacteriales bacterium]
MQLTKQAITDHASRIPGLDGYGIVVGEIERNVEVHPDIAIESCKSLIEGLCKKALEQVSEEYQRDKHLRNSCSSSLTKLVKTAFKHVYERGIEADLHIALYELLKNKARTDAIVERAKENGFRKTKEAIDKIVALRDTRGDISHGRVYPKELESEVQLARSVVAITDGICSYMIYQLSRQVKDPKGEEKVKYEDREDFNEWLDTKAHFIEAKVMLSVLLYEENYGKYQEIYHTDYQAFQGNLDELEEGLEEIEEEVESPTPEVRKVEEPEIPKEKPTAEEPKVLATDFDAKTFWTEKRLEQLKQFALEQSFDPEPLKAIIEKAVAFDETPIRSDLAKILDEKLNIHSYKVVMPAKVDAAMAFAKEL